MTQDERNRQVHEEALREFRAMTLEQRVQLLIECGILLPNGQLAPEYVAPPEHVTPSGTARDDSASK